MFVLTPVSWLTDHAPLSWIIKEPLHDHVREDRYAMVVLGTLLVGLVGLLGRRIGGDTVGLVAAGIAALSPNIWVNDGLVMSETLTMLTVTGALLTALWWRDKPSWRRAAAFGAVCGLATLARVEFVLLVPLLGIVFALSLPRPWAERWQQALVVVVGALVVITPWVGFNLARFNDPTFVSTNDGLTLAGANCAAVYYGPAHRFLVVVVWCRRGPRRPVAGLEPRCAGAGIDYAKDHAGRIPAVVLARVGRTWSLFRPLDMVKLNTGEDREPWVTRLGLVVYYPTLLLAIGGRDRAVAPPGPGRTMGAVGAADDRHAEHNRHLRPDPIPCRRGARARVARRGRAGCHRAIRTRRAYSAVGSRRIGHRRRGRTELRRRRIGARRGAHACRLSKPL